MVKHAASLACLLALVFACKEPDGSSVNASKNQIVSRPNCYTRLTLAELGRKVASAQEIKAFYSNGNCHGFKNVKQEQMTLDRYAETGSVFVSSGALNGKTFPEATAPVSRLCLQGLRVFLAKDCAKVDASSPLLGTVDVAEVGRSITFDPAKYTFDVSYNGAAVDSKIARQVGASKINLWVGIK